MYNYYESTFSSDLHAWDYTSKIWYSLFVLITVNQNTNF